MDTTPREINDLLIFLTTASEGVPPIDEKYLDVVDVEDPTPIFEWFPKEIELGCKRVNDNKDAIKKMFQYIDECVREWDRILNFTLKADNYVSCILASKTVNLFSKWYLFIHKTLLPSLRSIWSSNENAGVLEVGPEFSQFKEFGEWCHVKEHTKPNPCSRWVIQICALSALELLTCAPLFKYTRGVFGFQAGMVTCESPHLSSVKVNMAKVKMGNSSYFESGFRQDLPEDMVERSIDTLQNNEAFIKKAEEMILGKPDGDGGDAGKRLENLELVEDKPISLFWSFVNPSQTLPKHVVLRMCILWNVWTLRQLILYKIMPGVGSIVI